VDAIGRVTKTDHAMGRICHCIGMCAVAHFPNGGHLWGNDSALSSLAGWGRGISNKQSFAEPEPSCSV